jgi:hypothetical protein
MEDQVVAEPQVQSDDEEVKKYFILDQTESK